MFEKKVNIIKSIHRKHTNIKVVVSLLKMYFLSQTKYKTKLHAFYLMYPDPTLHFCVCRKVWILGNVYQSHPIEAVLCVAASDDPAVHKLECERCAYTPCTLGLSHCVFLHLAKGRRMQELRCGHPQVKCYQNAMKCDRTWWYVTERRAPEYN